MVTACIMPGCDQPQREDGFCKQHNAHLTRSLLGGDKHAPAESTASTITLWPARPARITKALHALAETPGLTPERYAREKARILKGHQT